MKQPVDEASEENMDEKAKEQLAMLEAALYVAGRPLDLKTLGAVIGTRSERRVQHLARMLMEEYRHRNTALEVLELEDQRFVLQLKRDYSSKARRLAIRPLLSDGPLKTLSYIAYRQPVTQKQVIDVRGRHVYSHIRQLIESNLVRIEKTGKTSVLRTTDYFADYF
ncbi:MAG: SMC-Scp complex subunit ScpB, partial [Nitrososphaerota archaeon]